MPPTSARAGTGRLPGLALILAVVLAIWQTLYWTVGDIAVASPATTLATIIDGVRRGWLVSSFAVTLKATLIAFVISATAGLALGFILGRSRFWGEVFEAPILWLYSIPKVVIYPILVLVFGLGLRSNVAFGILQGIFPPLLILYAAVRALPPTFIKTGLIYRMPAWRFFLRIVVPYTLPAIVMGLRYCFSLTYIGVVVAQMFAAEEGAGYLLITSISLGQSARMCAITAVIIVVALLINAVFLAAERAVKLHRPSFAGLRAA